ncbi:MAG TPA: vWA domain-containing protein [Candidatus Ozemobacteraceae bacterium]|nr:vWA domain-containing protein [Candidatus Ozemobacteraceae bacterium]
MKTLISLLGLEIGALQQLESIRLGFVWGWAEILLLALLFVPVIIWFYRLEEKPHTPSFRRLTLGLRLIFVIAILLLLAGPRFLVTGFIPQKNKIAVLVDASRSMSIVEEGKARIDRARDTLSQGRFLAKLEKQTELPPSLFSFAGQVSPLTADDISSFSVTPDGLQTNLTRAVTEVVSNLGESNLLGVILCTDGGHNTGDSPREALAGLRTPLYILGTGRANQARDLSISLERPPALGYLNSRVRVRGEVRLYRIATDTIPITIKRDGKPYEQIVLTVGSDSRRLPFSCNLPCDEEGAFTWTFSVPQVAGELTFDNNEAGFLLRVIKDRMRVLLLAGHADWDHTFLRQALQSDPSAQFNALVRVNEQRWLRLENFVLKGPITTPDIGSETADIDLLILAGISETLLRPHAENLTRRLESGQLGVLLLPAARGYAALGYRDSPLARWFPVELTSETWRGVPTSLLLPTREPAFGFLRLLDDPLQNQEFFQNTIPKFDGLFTYGRLKTGSQILLSSTLDNGGTPAPALISQRLGQGQVAMLTGGSLWPMGLRLVATGKGNRPYTAFTVNLLKWLANRREDSQVVLEIAAARGFVNQPTSIRAWVYDAARRPLETAQIVGTASGHEGETLPLSFLAAAEKGCYETAFIPPRKGKFEIRVEARSQGQSLGEARAQFLVEQSTAEFDNPEVQVELMQSLASMTGGVYRPAEESDQLLAQIKATPGKKRETRILELRDSWVLLALLLLFPLSEWILRRTRGFS